MFRSHKCVIGTLFFKKTSNSNEERVNEKGQSVLDKVYYSNKAWFQLSEYPVNPCRFEETSGRKIGARCGISPKKIFGSIFFDTIVNGRAYQNILMQFVAISDDLVLYRS